ncbi:MAG: DnaJ domain-containing protein [Micavibrio sp.]
MPKIRLKPGSAEFADDTSNHRSGVRHCDMPGCREHGEYKAPRDRSLSNHYYWFCLPHVQEYNKAWDFFSGMSTPEIEEQIIRSTLWDRPTRRYDTNEAMAEQLRRKAWQTYHFTEEEPPRREQTRTIDRSTPETEALAIFGLAPPVDMNVIKARYKELVKKYHPDVNPGDPKAEEMIKTINMSYTILRLAYEKFEQYEEKAHKK